MTSTDIQFRPIQVEDQALLFQVYSSTRTDVEAAGLEPREKLQFLQMQFAAQSQYYQATFPKAEFLAIMQADVLIGRLYIDRPGDEIHIIDIALLPEHRRQGIGSRLMADILEEATRADLPVRIYVEVYNTALAWYESLGFVKVEDIQTHFQMKWQPITKSSSDQST